jgi:hypothetical protein
LLLAAEVMKKLAEKQGDEVKNAITKILAEVE